MEDGVRGVKIIKAYVKVGVRRECSGLQRETCVKSRCKAPHHVATKFNARAESLKPIVI